MARKEKIIAGKNTTKPRMSKNGGFYYYSGGKRAYMGKTDEKRSNKSKKSDTFHYKGCIVNLPESYESGEKSKNECPIDKD